MAVGVGLGYSVPGVDAFIDRFQVGTTRHPDRERPDPDDVSAAGCSRSWSGAATGDLLDQAAASRG